MEDNPRAGRKSRKLGSRRRHQMRTVADEEDPPAPDTEQLPSQATEELQDFFRECGAEHKGFITREDLKKAKFSFLSSPEELELIFDWMDLERKGRLTSKEFTSGLKNVFSSQTRIPGPRKRKTRTWIFSKEEPTSFQPLEEADPEERKWFLSFMEQLGADHLFLDQTEIWQLWKKLRQEEPHLVGNLEGFLAKVTSRLQETRAEKEALQMTLKKCDDDHHLEVQQLYEEMEQQIHSEKQRIQAESDTQGLAYSSMMHHALKAKEQEVQHLAEGQRELEAQINLLKSKRHEVSMENQRLQETQRALTGQLEQVQGQLQVTRGHLNQARGQVVWQVEEETSLPSDPPVGSKNNLDSQQTSLFSEEDPLPSLFEEGDWSQLLKNFTSPLPGNSTQVSWSPPPTPTSLQGHYTPRVVKQISITKPNSWQLNQESPSDPDVPPRSSQGSSVALSVVSELNVADDPRSEVIFQWDFQRVPSGEPAITTGGQAAPVLGDSLASLDSLPSQGLAGSGKEIGGTDGDEVGQGDGPTSNMLSKGSSSEESQQILGLSADVQASTWKEDPTSHSGLHPTGSKQEVGSWEKEVFTTGPDGPIETPELVLLQGSTSKREKEQGKMNTDEWEVEASQQNDASDQETGLRESPVSDVGEVPGEGFRNRESLVPDVSEVPGEGSRSTESPGPDMGEVPGEGFRSTGSFGSDVGEVLGEGSRSTESPGPDVGEVPGKGSRSRKSSGPDADEVLGEGSRSAESFGTHVGEVPEGSRSSESSGSDVGEVLGEGSRSRESSVPDVGEVPGEGSGSRKSSGPDIGEVLGEGSRRAESFGSYVGEVLGEGSRNQESLVPDVGEVPGEGSGSIESVESEVGEVLDEGFRNQESLVPDVGEVPGEGSGSRESPVLTMCEDPGEGSRGTEISGPDMGEVPGEGSRSRKSSGPDVGEVLGEGSRSADSFGTHVGEVLEGSRSSESPGSDVGEVLGEGSRSRESPVPDVGEVPGEGSGSRKSSGPDIGEVLSEGSRRAESFGSDVAEVLGEGSRNQESLVPDVGEVPGEGSGSRESPVPIMGEVPGEGSRGTESSGPDVGEVPDEGFRHTESPGQDMGEVPGEGSRSTESPGSDVENVSSQEAGRTESPGPDIGNHHAQETRHVESSSPNVDGALDQILGSLELDVGKAPSEKTQIIHLTSFMQPPEIDMRNVSEQESKLIMPPKADADSTSGQALGLIRLDVGNVSCEEVRVLDSAELEKDNHPGQEFGLLQSPGPDVYAYPSYEVRLLESYQTGVGDATELHRLLMRNAPDLEAGLTESPGSYGNDVPGQETRFMESWETDIKNYSDKEARVLQSPEPDVGEILRQENVLMHSPEPGVADEMSQVAWIGLGDDTVQEARVTELYKVDVANTFDQGSGIIESPELHVDDTFGQEKFFFQSGETDMEDISGQKAEILYSPDLDLSGQKAGYRESLGSDVSDVVIQEIGFTNSLVIKQANSPGQEDKFMEFPEIDMGMTAIQESEFIDGESGPDIRNISGQESRLSETPRSDGGGTFLYSPSPDVGDALSEEAGLVEPSRMDAATVQGTEITELSKINVRNASDKETRFIKSVKMDASSGLIESPGSEMGNASGEEAKLRDSWEIEEGVESSQEAKLRESWEIDMGNAEITEIIYSSVPDMSDSLDQEVGIVELHGLYVSETSIQEARVLESLEKDMGDGSVQGVVIRESYESGVGNTAAQDIEIRHKPGSGKNDSTGPEVEILNSPGLYVGDSIVQETGVTELPKSNVGNSPDQETSFMPSSKTYVSADQEVGFRESYMIGGRDNPVQEVGFKESSVLDLKETPGQEGRFIESPEAYVDDKSNHQVKQSGSPGSDVRDVFCQEGGFRESYETDEEDTLGLTESTGLGEIPSQEGSFLEFLEENVDDSSQVTEQAGSPGPDVKDASDQESGFRESYEKNMKDALGKEIEFGINDGDAGQGILLLEKHEPDVGDGSAQDTDIVYLFRSSVSDSADLEVESMHLPGLYVVDSIVQESRVTELQRLDGRNGSDQEARFMPSSEAYVRDAPHQEAEILPFGPEVEDSSGQESGFKESSSPSLVGAPGQEDVLLESFEAGVNNAPNHQIGQTRSPGSDVRDNLGQEVGFRESYGIVEEDTFGFMESRVLGETQSQEDSFLKLSEEGSSQITKQTGLFGSDMEEAPDQRAGFRKSYETDLRDTLGKEVEFSLDGGDPIIGQGILVQEKHEPNLGDASRPDQITGLTESYEPEINDIMHLPDSDRCDAFGEEAKFRELCETDVGDIENAEIMCSAVPDMSDSPSEEAGIVEIHELNVSEIPIQEARVLESSETDMSDGPGQEVMIRESYEEGVGNTSAQDTEIIYSPRLGMNDSTGSEAEFLHSPGSNVGDSCGQEAGVTELHRSDVGNAPDQARFMPSSETDLSDTIDQEVGFRKSYMVAGGDIPGQEAEILHSPGSEIEDSSGQETGQEELSVLGQEDRFIESSKEAVDEGSNHQVGQTVSYGPDVRKALGQEGEFRESCETDEEDTLGLMESTDLGGTSSKKGSFLELPDEDVNDGSIEITEQTGPNVEDAPDQDSGFRKSYENDLRDALGKEVEFGRNISAQETEIMHSLRPSVSDSAGPEAEKLHILAPNVRHSMGQEAGILHSPGPEVKDSPVQEVRLKESSELDLGGTLGQEGRFMESSEAGVDDGSNHKDEQTELPGPDVRDALGQEGDFGVSCDIDEEETLGLMESRLLGETPSQEGSFLEFPEKSVDDGSQVTEQAVSPGPDVKDAPGQEVGFRESYEKDMKAALGKEIEFGTIDGDEITGQGILMLEKHEPDVGDASRPDQITGHIESYGPEISDIPIQEAEIMYSPGSDRFLFGKEAKFREFCETDVGDTENAEIMHSPVSDISDIPGENETPVREARVLASPETDVSDGPDQEVRFMPSETDLSDAVDQEAGFRESYVVVLGDIPDEEAEILHSPGLEVEDSSSQENGLKESSELDLGRAPSQEDDFMEPSKEAEDDGSNHQIGQIVSPGPDVRDALVQEGEFRKPCEIDKEDTLGFMESTGMGETPSKKGFLESPKEDVNDGGSQVIEQTGSPGSDMMNVLGQEAGVMELHNLYVSKTPIQKAKVLESSETDMSDGPGQEVVIREAYETDMGDASAQDIEIIYSPRSGVSGSAGLEFESMQSPDSYVVDSIVQEVRVTELQRPDMRNTSNQEIRCTLPSEANVRDAPDQEAEILPSGPEAEDSPGQEFGFKESSVPNLGGAPGQKDEHLESLKTSVDERSNTQVGQTEIFGPHALDQEGGFSEFYEIDEEHTLGLMEAEVLHLRDTPSEEGKFLKSPEEGVNAESGQVTEQARSPGLDLRDAPGQEAGFKESYEKDMRDVLAKEGEFLDSFVLDGGDTVTGQGILMLETHEPDVGDTSSLDQIAGFIESCGPEMGDISSQVAEIVYSPGSGKCDASGHGDKLRELHETDVGDTEIMYSPVSEMSDSPGQEAEVVKLQGLYVSETPIQDARVLESPETDVSDGSGQEDMNRESYKAGVGNTSAQDTEILHSPRPRISDSTGPKAEILHSPGPYSTGQEAGVTELHRLDVGNAPDQKTRFLPSSETEVRYPEAQGVGLTKSSVLDLRGAPVQESRFLELPEAGVVDWSCQQVGQIRSPGPDVRHAPGQETEILHSPSHDVNDQETGRFIDSSRSIVDSLSDEEVHLPQSPGPDVGDVPEEKSGDNQSPRPDVLPVIPEHGGLQDQNPEDVWRAEDRGLQKQAQEGVLFPKDSSGNTLGRQDSGQDLSIPMETGTQSGSKVLREQITRPSSEPREESQSEVTKETRLKTKAQAFETSPGGESSDPDYLFHVLFLGDSNVGKTSFLHLLHYDSFASGLTATVGMDYRIKNLVVDNQRFALQLWDTAGQERYHSITKQFLRKADGIVLMYDVTCPGSFTHVRYWLDCIQEAGPDDVIILLLGNKIDCEEKRLVSTEAGQLLAKEIGVTFGECSAALGHNILEPIVTLARAMKEQDTKLKHSAVDLERKEMKKKSGCCS